jgi:ABC-2 type transport system ATP-binding protein
VACPPSPVPRALSTYSHPIADSAIALRDLAKSYGSVHAVRGISLDVRRAEIFGFLGLNGAGKTTTIRILLDLLRPSRGSAEVFRHDCQRESRKTRAMIGYLPGELGLYADMRGGEVLDLMERLGERAVDAGYRHALLDRLELARADLRRTLREYSTGMKRKLGLVQALQSDPPLLLLDEPTEGLDPLVQRALHEILIELRARGRTVFMSSHVLSEVERLCDRIAVIRSGEIVLLSTVEEARRRSGRILRVHFATGEVKEIPVAGDIGPLLPQLTNVRDIEIVEPSLEDVLASFYREGTS